MKAISSYFDATPPRRVVKGIINVEPILSGELAEFITIKVIENWIGSVIGFANSPFSLEFVAADLDLPCKEKETLKVRTAYDKFNKKNEMFEYKFEFEVPKEFGKIGAVLVENEHHRERYIKSIVLNHDNGVFSCESWIRPSKPNNSDKRIFFTNKSYLPSETPTGLKSFREKDLESLRGNGKGKRESIERIYDYDTYNDLGDPDNIESDTDLSRPVLGGENQPYPRRCRTGRDMTNTEAWSESREKVHFYDQFYVPRDEAFSDRKVVAFGASAILKSIKQALHLNLFSSKEEANTVELDQLSINYSSIIEKTIEEVIEWLLHKRDDFNHFKDVVRVVVPRFIGDLYKSMKNVEHIDGARNKDKISFSWLSDKEFCRQTLAGINPYSIKLVKESEWPLKSKLPIKVYGPAESAITKEIVEKEINKQSIQGFLTLEEALEQKRLFLLDYHDLLLPYVHEVREVKEMETTLYGSRTLMFLMADDTLKPVAIELTRPPINGKPQWKQVYIPCTEPKDAATKDIPIEAWLWKLAKAHVLAHDSGYHQLISHWLRTHCVMEPYIIATHRCLSKMHPIHRLLFPHLRYTMQINSLARLLLINADGIIESTFFPGKYSMKLSSDVYAQQWRFDHEALPVDLIRRGMAVKDPHPDAPHGLKLVIKDYPFANDGLFLWDAIKKWATSYVKHYYKESDLVESDEELQAWWNEIQTKGHEDKTQGWPELENQKDLIEIVTTIMWVASGHHSAVNFDQYTAGYSPPKPYPPRPTIARTNMPDEDKKPEDDAWKEEFLKDPKKELGNCFPTIKQSKRVKFTLDILSSHSPDEEYIGDKMEASWESDPVINKAFGEFRKRLEDLEHKIDTWNGDHTLGNRKGEGQVPYEIFKAKSEAGVTGKGVPYSVSI